MRMPPDAIYRDYDRSGLEAQYNLRISHPERDAVYARYAAASEAVRVAAGGRYDVPYGPAARQRLDIFPAESHKAKGGAPVLLFFHGGYWRALDKSVFSMLAPAFVAEGWTVVLPNYTLAPAATIDAIVAEARAATAWVARNLLPPGAPLVVCGHSAGGHLTAMTVLTDWGARGFDRPIVGAGVTISGIFELEPVRHTSINELVGLNADSALHNSPIGLIAPSGAPLMLIVGGNETAEFHGQTTRFAEAWHAHGNTAETVIAEGHDHFTILGAVADAAAPLHRTVSAFLNGFR